jgi:hypothetical protein
MQMKTLMTTTAALILGLAAQAVAFAGDGHGHAGRQTGHTIGQGNGPVRINNPGNGTGNSLAINNKANFTQGQTGTAFNKNGLGNGKHIAFKDYKGACYYGKNCNFWSKSCFNDHYGCYTYWCPRTYCWFYWCQPYGCYLPVDYCPTGCYAY